MTQQEVLKEIFATSDWYRPSKARLFHAYKDGRSRCGAWTVTKPFKRMEQASMTEMCGTCRRILADRRAASQKGESQ